MLTGTVREGRGPTSQRMSHLSVAPQPGRGREHGLDSTGPGFQTVPGSPRHLQAVAQQGGLSLSSATTDSIHSSEMSPSIFCRC